MSLFNNAIIGASGQGGYRISRSVRLRSSASAYLSRTLTTPTNNKIWTWSGWIKRGKPGGSSASGMHLFGTGSASTDAASTQIQFDGENLLLTGYATNWLKSNAVYRDPSAWYHIVVAWDNSNATVANRAKIYVNGIEISYSIDNRASLSTSSTYGINQAVLHTIGAWSWNNGTFAQPEYYDGYLTEINFIDGQALTPSSFGETNSVTGVWQPKKYGGTYGTNGFYLNFSDNSNNTATTIGKDYSGNGNNWTPNNISVTAGVTYDSMLDVPTLYADGGNGRGNYSVMNPLAQEVAGVVIDGNLRLNNAAASNGNSRSTIAFPSSGLWYVEGTVGSTTSASVAIGWGVILASVPVAGGLSGYNTANTWSIYASNISNLNNNGSVVGSGGVFTAGDVLQVAVDRNNNRVWVGKNNTWYNSTYGTTGDPATGANPTFTSVTANDITLFAMVYANSFAINFGQRPFTYTPPTGFVALNTQNLPTPNISNGANYMAASTYTGTGATQSIVNSGNNAGAISFQPDFVWVKSRSSASYSHRLFDVLRGTNVDLQSNTTNADTSEANSLTAFNSNGYSVGIDNVGGGVNTNTVTYVGWQWNAGGSTVTNTSGSISAQVRANPTAGFSIVTYTGTGANATVGHGLGVAPKMIIIKGRNFVADWVVYHASIGNTAAVFLNTTGASSASSLYFQNTTPTSSVFSLGIAGGVNNSSSNTYVAYCFAAVAGYSAFGSYTGNGSTDGPFVFTNFQPRWVMVKRTDSTSDWYIWDTSRDTYNVETATLLADTSGAETSATSIDGLSNGFKCRSATVVNASGGTYIYAAFASSPFKLSLAR
jgi:hypothetical protein